MIAPNTEVPAQKLPSLDKPTDFSFDRSPRGQPLPIDMLKQTKQKNRVEYMHQKLQKAYELKEREQQRMTLKKL